MYGHNIQTILIEGFMAIDVSLFFTDIGLCNKKLHTRLYAYYKDDDDVTVSNSEQLAEYPDLKRLFF